MNNLKIYIRFAAVIVLVFIVLATHSQILPAQDIGAIGRQTLGRPYWHVFLAYLVSWILIFGWLISIARGLRRIENRLGEQ